MMHQTEFTVSYTAVPFVGFSLFIFYLLTSDLKVFFFIKLQSLSVESLAQRPMLVSL